MRRLSGGVSPICGCGPCHVIVMPAEVRGADAERRAQRLEHLRSRAVERAVGEADARDLLDERLLALRVQALGQRREVVAERATGRARRDRGRATSRRSSRRRSCGPRRSPRGPRPCVARSPAASIDDRGDAHRAAEILAERRPRSGVFRTSGRKHVPHVEHFTCSPSGLADREERDEEEREPAPDLLQDVGAVGAAAARRRTRRSTSALARSSEPADENHGERYYGRELRDADRRLGPIAQTVAGKPARTRATRSGPSWSGVSNETRWTMSP